jgi:hypothetical protein
VQGLGDDDQVGLLDLGLAGRPEEGDGDPAGVAGVPAGDQGDRQPAGVEGVGEGVGVPPAADDDEDSVPPEGAAEVGRGRERVVAAGVPDEATGD